MTRLHQLTGTMPAIDSPSAWLTVLVIDFSVCTVCNAAADCTYRVIFMVGLLSQLDQPPTKTRATLPCCLLYAGKLSITKWYYTAEMEARQHLLAHVVVVTQRTPAPAYNAVAVSCYCASLQCRGRLSRPRRLTTRRTACPSAPAYNATAGSSVCAPSDATVVFTVCLSRPGLYQHTGTHLSA